jgi:hypothetical protein
MSECEECLSSLFAVVGQPESGELIPSGSEKLESGELTPSLCFDRGLVCVYLFRIMAIWIIAMDEYEIMLSILIEVQDYVD